MDTTFGPSWQVIIGEDFTFSIDFERFCLVYLFYGNVAILVWKVRRLGWHPIHFLTHQVPKKQELIIIYLMITVWRHHSPGSESPVRPQDQGQAEGALYEDGEGSRGQQHQPIQRFVCRKNMIKIFESRHTRVRCLPRSDTLSSVGAIWLLGGRCKQSGEGSNLIDI